MKIKSGDRVKILTGKDKGKDGIVIKVIKSKKGDRVVVSGVNICKKSVKPRNNNAGGIVNVESSIHISNVAFYDAKEHAATKIGYKFVDGKKVRYAKLSGEIIG